MKQLLGERVYVSPPLPRYAGVPSPIDRVFPHRFPVHVKLDKSICGKIKKPASNLRPRQAFLSSFFNR